MADEIIVLNGTRKSEYTALFYYDIPLVKRLTVGDTGVNVVHSPSASLPEPAATVMAQGKKDALDAGEALYVTRRFNLIGMTNPQMVAALESAYTSMSSTLLADYTAKYEHHGTELDKP